MSEETEEIKLTGKQKLFADYYVGEAHCNGTRAAKLAGYSEKTAYSIASENLRKPEVLEYIEKRLDEIAMTTKEVLAGFTAEAKASISDVLGDDGEFDYVKMCERGADKFVKKLKIKKTTRREKGSDDEIEELTHEFELYDAQAAKAHIAKIRGMFVDKSEVEHKGGIKIEQQQDLSKLSKDDLLSLKAIQEKLNAA